MAFWGSFAAKLARHYRVIRFDARHAGASSFEGTFTLADVAGDAAALLEHLGIAPVLVVGHAWGGRVAQVFARDFPHLVRGMVICGTGGELPPVDTATIVAQQKAARAAGDREAWQAAFEALWFAPGYRERAPGKFSEIFDLLSTMKPRHQARWDARACPSASYWGKARVPARLFYGKWDKNGTPENGTDLAAKLDCELTLFDDAGHFLVREKEDEMIAGIEAFAGSLT